MWTFFLILAIFGVMALLFYLVIELNELEKRIATLADEIRKNYETT